MRAGFSATSGLLARRLLHIETAGPVVRLPNKRRAARAARAAVAAPEVAEATLRTGLEASSSTPTELANAWREENAPWAPVLKTVGFAPDV